MPNAWYIGNCPNIMRFPPGGSSHLCERVLKNEKKLKLHIISIDLSDFDCELCSY